MNSTTEHHNHLSPIRKLDITTHKICLIQSYGTRFELRASGFLVGRFYENVPISSNEEVEFVGDFNGYIDDLDKLKEG